MFKIFQKSALFSLCFFLAGTSFVAPDKNSDIESFIRKNDPQILTSNLTIKSVVIQGNKTVQTPLIINKIPFREGLPFDPNKSALAINNLYALGHFSQVEIKAKEVDSQVVITIILNEKTLMGGVTFEGNKALTTKKIIEKFSIDKLTHIDDETAEGIVELIKKMYHEENYHRTKIKHKLVPSVDNPGKVMLVFTINEGEKSAVYRVEFVGNKKIPSRKLRKWIFTRENWLFSFMDTAGTYNQDEIEKDAHRIQEGIYREYGYMMAKVYKTETKFSADHKDIVVTFYIQEGDQFSVNSVKLPETDLFGEDELEAAVTIQEGKPYVNSVVADSMNRLRNMWGEKGYINADIIPNVVPDEKNKTVDIAFYANPGNKIYTNRIMITGNKITRDSIIRRRLDIVEGDLVTSKKLQTSKNAVEFLSFFEPGGVNWLTHRISDDLADLELNLKETKTGNFNFNLSFGPAGESEQKNELRAAIMLEKGNLLGHGIDTGFVSQLGFDRFKPGMRRLEARIVDPHIFGKDVSAGLYVYRRWDEYDRWQNSLTKIPKLDTMGTNVRFGFGLPEIDKRLQLVCDLGVETIRNNNPQVPFDGALQNPIYQILVNRTFQQGSVCWIGLDLVKDMRNHQVYPNSGYRLALSTKTAPSGLNQTFGFFRVEAQASMYTAILNDDDLVLGNHIKLCNVQELGNSKIIPYKELFHMGGPTTVRGFVWSGIGPAWKSTNDPLGGRSAVQINNELTFPLAAQMGMRAHVFYDAGAAWDSPDQFVKEFNQNNPAGQLINFDDVVTRNKFTMRHTVGFGVNLTTPIPAKLDWGYKLDRDRNSKESAHEFHLTMNYAW